MTGYNSAPSRTAVLSCVFSTHCSDIHAVITRTQSFSTRHDAVSKGNRHCAGKSRLKRPRRGADRTAVHRYVEHQRKEETPHGGAGRRAAARIAAWTTAERPGLIDQTKTAFLSRTLSDLRS